MTTAKPKLTNHDRREAFAALFHKAYLEDSKWDHFAWETYQTRLEILADGTEDQAAEAWGYVSPNSTRYNEVRHILDRLPDNPTWGDYINYEERQREKANND